MSEKKAKHEIAMEDSKEMLDKGIGMTEIQNTTGLSQKDVNKSRRKIEDED